MGGKLIILPIEMAVKVSLNLLFGGIGLLP
jgi:hypothetical protein